MTEQVLAGGLLNNHILADYHLANTFTYSNLANVDINFICTACGYESQFLFQHRAHIEKLEGESLRKHLFVWTLNR